MFQDYQTTFTTYEGNNIINIISSPLLNFKHQSPEPKVQIIMELILLY